jgi:biopolymer transport protein ExbD
VNLRRRRRPSPAIPIVALVDILVITLLFIVATTTFKPKEQKKEVKINLPTASQLGQNASAKVVRKSLTATKENKYFLDGKEIAEGDLVAALKELKSSAPDARVELAVDKQADHGLYVAALDALVRSGFAKDITTLVQRAVEGANRR